MFLKSLYLNSLLQIRNKIFDVGPASGRAAPFSANQNKTKFFLKFCQRAQMEFSDFVLKKQIQSGQIRKLLVGVAGCTKLLKLILIYILPAPVVF